MITVNETSRDLIKVELELKPIEIIAFLLVKGYDVKEILIEIPATEEFLVSEQAFNYSTYTAMKTDGQPTINDFYLKVFETELNQILNII